jgi:hypothetical protein
MPTIKAVATLTTSQPTPNGSSETGWRAALLSILFTHQTVKCPQHYTHLPKMSMFSRFNKKDGDSARNKSSSKKDIAAAAAADTFDEDMDLSAAKAAIRGKCSSPFLYLLLYFSRRSAHPFVSLRFFQPWRTGAKLKFLAGWKLLIYMSTRPPSGPTRSLVRPRDSCPPSTFSFCRNIVAQTSWWSLRHARPLKHNFLAGWLNFAFWASFPGSLFIIFPSFVFSEFYRGNGRLTSFLVPSRK